MELLKIRTDQFEGPLDLLLFLIQKNEMDVSAISIHKITDQYVQYIEIMRELNFDVASEFLVMAATLIHLKSKRLLPADDVIKTSSGADDAPLSEQELVRRLLEYKKFQEAGKTLHGRPFLNRDVFSRPNVLPPEKQTIWNELDITGLTLAFQDVLKRSRHRTQVVLRDSLSIPECIVRLSGILVADEPIEFSRLLSENVSRSEIVVVFISLLELARLKKIKILQHSIFGTIYVLLLENISELDPNIATGFQYNVKRIEELAIHG